MATIFTKQLKQFLIYRENDLNIGSERSCVDERDLSHMV